MRTSGTATVLGKLFALGALGLLASAACSLDTGRMSEDSGQQVVSAPAAEETAARHARGREVFQSYCSFCHEISDHTPGVGLGGAGLTEAYLLKVLRQPPPGMPVVPLQDQARAELVSYLKGIAPEVFREQSERP